MIDITGKIKTHRTALARAKVVVSKHATIEAVKNLSVPKGNVLESARVAGLFAVKKTSEMIPDCHPLPIEYTSITFTIDGLEIAIDCEVQTIYKTGVEVEAMHGVSVAALTIYDMLKPIDKGIEIHSIRLIEKKGGKSHYKDKLDRTLKAAVVVCSDSISAGKNEDRAGKAIAEKLRKLDVEICNFDVVADKIKLIQNKVNELMLMKPDLIILTGGSGLSERDVTPEALKPMFDREIPGIAEAMRSYGQERMPYSMLSRSIAGIKGKTLILSLPGSTRGAKESMDALFPYLLHFFKVMEEARHE